MNKASKLNAAKYMLLFSAVVYLFVAISHIFYLPHYNVDNTTQTATKSNNSIFKRHTSAKDQQEPVEIKRTDKTTSEEKKNVAADITQLAAVAFVLIFAAFGLVRLASKVAFPVKQLIYNRQYAYLQLCTFRI